MKITDLTYRIVGLCNQFPSLSWLDKDKTKALEGIQKVAEDCLSDWNAEQGA